ncbi:hypothetical protein C7I55_14930 [Sphingomonas deserti]|uniref:Uncharacterized protein n=1 Tax=Allosphingosinicella deserti TaxID=2116704 RepID=A0A2P7QPE9_9SPHN|nr:hypothetical protein C7I55_14930 [Sphingomonas deserti]
MGRRAGVVGLFEAEEDVGGAIALAVGLVSSYTFYRLKDQDDLHAWEQKMLRPAGYMLAALFLGLAGLLFAMMAFDLTQA